MDRSLAWSALITLLFLGALVLWIRRRIRLRHAHTWPVCKGTVVSTAVRLEGSGTEQHYIAEMNYSYETGGARYFGRMRRNFMLHGRAHGWAEKYPSGRRVLVHYDPADPRDAVLFEEEQAQSAGAA